jgi:hypothetical protein
VLDLVGEPLTPLLERRQVTALELDQVQDGGARREFWRSDQADRTWIFLVRATGKRVDEGSHFGESALALGNEGPIAGADGLTFSFGESLPLGVGLAQFSIGVHG